MTAKLKAASLKSGLSNPRKQRDRFEEAGLVASDGFLTSPPGADARNGASAEHYSSVDSASGGSYSATHHAKAYTPKMPLVSGVRYMVPIKLVDDNPHNPREFYLPAALSKLAASIAREGQMQAAQAYPPTAENPHFVLKEGHSRKRVMHQLQLQHIVLEVVPRQASLLDDYRQARELNKQRNDLTVFDDAVRFRKMLDAKVFGSQESLAKDLGESSEYVSKVLKVGRMPEVLVRRMAESVDYRFGAAMAYCVALFHELRGEPTTSKLITRVVEERISVRQVEALLQQAKSATSTALPTRQRPIGRASVGGASGAGEVKLFPDRRLEVSLSLARDELGVPLLRDLGKLLKKHGFSVEGLDLEHA